MAAILRDHATELQLELAAILDIRELVRVNYSLEGDRLEILLAKTHTVPIRDCDCGSVRELAGGTRTAVPNLWAGTDQGLGLQSLRGLRD